ncbi:MAG: M48 family metalloprotease [Acutalibacteraceae bacterium]
MNNEYQKYGISDDDIISAALGDFDGFSPVSSQPKTEKQHKSQQNTVQSMPKENTNITPTQPKKQVLDEDESDSTRIPKIEKTSGFYVIDFVKSLFTKEKVGVCIWLIVNMLLVSTPMGITFMAQYNDLGADAIWLGLLYIAIGIVFYLITLVIAMSPVGETILRWQNKCKPIKDVNVKNRLEPIFNRVYEKAKTRCPAISDKVSFFISRDECPNAFATGRRTVCVTQGLLDLSDDEIEGVLAHEFGHLAHKDTDVILAVEVGNMIVVGTLTVINVITNFSLRIADMFSKGDSAKTMYKIINVLFYAVAFLWTKLGVLFCMHSSRKNEFAADNFAVDLGYHKELADALTELDDGEFAKPKGLWAALHDSHPETTDRIVSMNDYASAK